MIAKFLLPEAGDAVETDNAVEAGDIVDAGDAVEVRNAMEAGDAVGAIRWMLAMQ